jgi:hypothetical protein
MVIGFLQQSQHGMPATRMFVRGLPAIFLFVLGPPSQEAA